jgi:hypothetical protein
VRERPLRKSPDRTSVGLSKMGVAKLSKGRVKAASGRTGKTPTPVSSTRPAQAAGPAPAKPFRLTQPYKLSREAILNIVAGLRRGDAGTELARRHGVSTSAVHAIKSGKVYREITGGAIAVPLRKPGRPSKGKRAITRCIRCFEPRSVEVGPTSDYCRPCQAILCPPIYDRDKGIGTIPINLRCRYSLSG